MLTSLVSQPLFELQGISRTERKSKQGRLCNAMSHTSDVLVCRILHPGVRTETAQLLKFSAVTTESACLPFTASVKISNVLGSSA